MLYLHYLGVYLLYIYTYIYTQSYREVKKLHK